MSRRPQRMAIEYPTWRIKGKPTPNEKLVVCDTCGKAEWTAHFPNPVVCHNYHHHPGGKNRRMREATPAEYKAAKAKLKTEI